MSNEAGDTYFFTDLEPCCLEARTVYPFPFRVLESADASAAMRRDAFRGLLSFVLERWMSAEPSASKLPRRRQVSLAFLAIVDSSRLASLGDAELMSLYSMVVARPSGFRTVPHVPAKEPPRYNEPAVTGVS